MDHQVSRSILPNPTSKRSRIQTIVPRSAHVHDDKQEFLKDPSLSDLSGRHSRKDKGFVIVKGNALVPLVKRNQDQETNISEGSSNKHPATAPTKSTRVHWNNHPSTTYRRHPFKPYVYDNTIMLTNNTKRRLNSSRTLDYPNVFDLTGAETREVRSNYVGYDSGWFPKRGQSSRLHALKITNILFQSAPLQDVNYGISSVGISTSQLPSANPNSSYLSFSTTAMHSATLDTPQIIDIQPFSTFTPVIDESLKQRTMLKHFRSWEYTSLGRVLGVGNSINLTAGGTRFTLLNYNILAQVHLKAHMNLYKDCAPEALAWEGRAHLLFRDIDEISPDILCFQEVEEAEFHYTLVPALDHAGYRGVFKKRARDKLDGCAIFWSKDMFRLIGKLTVDLYQPHIPLLDRDNASLMVKLESKVSRTQQRLVVATTHLLFNPKRTDVKLGQVQLLLAELDRFSFSGMNAKGESVYYPLILCGDFNTEPYRSIHHLITEGCLQHLDDNDRLPKWFQKDGALELLPPYFGISDQCQHYKIQLERFKRWKSHRRTQFELDRKTQADLINLFSETRPASSADSEFTIYDDNVSIATNQNELTLTNELDTLKHVRVMEEMSKSGIDCSFGSGTLSHGLKLRNIYDVNLGVEKNGENVATTKQSAWKCVDFIFQGMQWNSAENRRTEGKLKLIRRLGLLTRSQCKELGPIPNFATSSDHYPLVAEFLLK